MAVQPTFPGVYLEEVPSSVRTIVGVSTSVTAFVGYLTRGPMNTPVQIFNFGDFERVYGGLNADSEVSYAVQQFFLNGGTEAWVVRTSSGDVRPASVMIGDGSGGTALEVEAIHPGSWGNDLRIRIDYPVTDPGDRFALTVQRYERREGEMVPVNTESFPNLSTDISSDRYVQGVINDEFSGSGLIRIRGVGSSRPQLTGTLSANVSSLGRLQSRSPELEFTIDGIKHTAELPIILQNLRHAGLQWTRSPTNANEYYVEQGDGGDPGLVEPSAVLADGNLMSSGSAGSLGEQEWAWADNDTLRFQTVYVRLSDSVDPDTMPPGFLQMRRPPASPTEARAALERAIHAADPANVVFANASVSLLREEGGSQRLRVLAGPDAGPAAIVSFSQTSSDTTTVAELGLDGTPGAQTNVQMYELGAGSVSNSSQNGGLEGRDGEPPNAAALVGEHSAKTGMYALEDVDLFNLLVIPRAAMVSGPQALNGDRTLAMSQAATVLTAATDYCRDRRAFLLVDPPNDVDDVQEIREWIKTNAALRHQNAAVYFPRLGISDPLNEFKLRWIGPSGTVAGLYARMDSERGVWKAPAGTGAVLRGTRKLETKIADTGSGVLNPLGINALRSFPVYGTVSWGARTLIGSDQQASPWKYIPVRRTALFIEESLYRGTQWVVFEPNDESLWAQIRLNVGTFMQRLFRQGAFQGTSPREAYLVKCDSETTTQTDINRGIVNIVVGFAPLKPAEFVIIRIQQLAGQE